MITKILNTPLMKTIAIFVLFAVSVLVLKDISGVVRVPILKPLNLFPKQIGEYEFAGEKKSSQGVIDLLGVDDYINYVYVSPQGIQIDFYLAYYESVNKNSTYHSPKNCLPGSGWSIRSVDTIQLDSVEKAESKVSVSELTLQQGRYMQTVLYWYQNRGRIISSEYWEKIYLVNDAIFNGRRDGSFVRIIANIPEGQKDNVREETHKFAESVMAELKLFIPGRNQ